MSRAALVDMARRTLAHAKAGSAPLEAGIRRVPAVNYVDADRHAAEMNRIFGRVPVVATPAVDVAEPGSWRAIEIAGVPLLVVRGADGDLRAFVNACRHRGAQIVTEPAGTDRRFTCPYHGWVYSDAGRLVSVADGRNFGDVDPDSCGLAERPCAQRAGLVFVKLHDDGVDIDTYLCGYDDLLAHLELADCHLAGRQVVTGPNWKVAYDGYLDFYHLPVLHRDSFGPDTSNRAIYDAWGPHQRVSSPDESILRFDGVDEADWGGRRLTEGIWTVFPHVSIARFPLDRSRHVYMVSQLLPGPGVDRSTTVQSFLTPDEPDDELTALVDDQMTFLRHVVEVEDYGTGARLQTALATGALESVMFGRNEGGGQRFHSWVDDLVAASDDELHTLFADATEYHQG